ncbi:uncharacterized protein LOC142977324 [Anticarsia gemmatalis]|uniref:uncharacterized protein LOC142977324 n=1 Tax=Anticarsia gemmatalis TaxID=129554 RepID=UPI003F77464F
MNIVWIIANVLFFLNSVLCRDYYAGMFKRNDFLVAQDTLYKDRRPYSYSQGEYGRVFKCPITYIRVVDRLGMAGPTVKIVRGGLQKKYVSIRIRSGYNLPISVNVYIGCENKKPPPPLTRRTTTTTTKSKAPGDDSTAGTATTGTGGTGGTGTVDQTTDATTPEGS